MKLAALHFYENSNKKQATMQDGLKRYSISFLKYKQGCHTVWQVAKSSTYSKKIVVVY